MKLKEPLNYAGRLYETGESVKGKLPLEMIEALLKNNKLDEVDADTAEVLIDQNQEGTTAPDLNAAPGDLGNLPIDGHTLITPEDFAKLPAQNQKEKLSALEIDPASHADNRFKQYEDWYFEQINNAVPDAQ